MTGEYFGWPIMILGIAVAGAARVDGQPYGAKDPVMGIYEGSWSSAEGKGRAFSQIRSRGEGLYDGFILLNRGATNLAVIKIASEKEDSNREPTLPINLHGLGFATQTGPAKRLEATVQIGKSGQRTVLSARFTGELGEGEIQAGRMVRKPATLGMKPPPGAVVMFD